MKVRALGLLLVITALLSTQSLSAQQPEARRNHPNRAAMMEEREHQMRMVDSMNARLDSMVRRMNQATGNTKTERMAQVITEMVAQRKTMQQQMRDMMERMVESHRGMERDMMKMNDSQPVVAPPRQDTTGTDTGHAGHHPQQ
jgi:uncharacterized protein involved in exopolysaccharide biosynthesis